MLPGPLKTKITKAEGGYVVEFDYRPDGRKTIVRGTKLAPDEFELRAVLKELYG